MTALELELQGVRFLGGHPPRVRGPRELGDAIRAEVDRRKPRVDPLPPAADYGACCCCGDPMPTHRGGMCGLCVLARWKVLNP